MNADEIKNNQRALKHGGEGAIRRVSEGKPFIGLAAEAEKEVVHELQSGLVSDLVKRDAIRLQTCADLYWNAVLKAAEAGDVDALDRYVARFGWLQGVTLRAWAQVTAEEKQAAKGSKGVIDVLQAIKEAANDTNK